MKVQRRKFRHGQDAGKLLLALWLFVSPWMLNYTKVSPAVWNGDIVGVIVAVFSLAAILKFTVWEEWINIAAGFWLIASPWVLDYTSLLPPTATAPLLQRYATQSALPASANHLAVGLAIVILSLWELNLSEEAIQDSPNR